MIRAATAADLPAVAALEAEVFGVDAWDETALAAELTGPGRRFVVTEDLAGYAISMTLADITDLQRIAVRPARQREGIAAALLADLLAHTDRADRMLLEVSAANRAAVAFYVANGFSQIDVRPRYYRDGSDALVLRRSLTRGCGGSGRMGP